MLIRADLSRNFPGTLGRGEVEHHAQQPTDIMSMQLNTAGMLVCPGSVTGQTRLASVATNTSFCTARTPSCCSILPCGWGMVFDETSCVARETA